MVRDVVIPSVYAGFSATPFFTPQSPLRFSVRMYLEKSDVPAHEGCADSV